MSTKVWIHGIRGKMGQWLMESIHQSSHYELIGGSGKNHIELYENGHKLSESKVTIEDAISQSHLIIDFSTVAGNASLLEVVQKISGQRSYLIATTGLPKETLSAWEDLGDQHGNKVLLAANTSLGVLLTHLLSRQVAKTLRGLDFDIEVSETHHRHKVDSPSGTALFLAEGLAEQEEQNLTYGRKAGRKPGEIGISSLRGGAVFGEHTIHFLGEEEELTITHKALSRRLFANGALVLSGWLLQKGKQGVNFLKDINLDELSY